MIVKKNKIFIILLLIAVLFCIGTKVYASGDELSDLFTSDKNTQDQNIKTWNYTPSIGNLSTADSKIMKGAAWGIKLIKTVSIFAAVISLIVLGMETILGSVEEKAVNKKKITTLVVGVLFMSSVMAIVSIIFENIAKT